MATKRKGLARGLDGMLAQPEGTAAAAETTPTDEQLVGSAVGQFAMLLNETLPAIDDYHATRMLRMVIALCQSELKGVHLA